jgi:hypothetical protein
VNTAQVELCEQPQLRLSPVTGTARLVLLFHTTDPDSTVHVELSVHLDPSTGRFYFSGDWLL